MNPHGDHYEALTRRPNTTPSRAAGMGARPVSCFARRSRGVDRPLHTLPVLIESSAERYEPRLRCRPARAGSATGELRAQAARATRAGAGPGAQERRRRGPADGATAPEYLAIWLGLTRIGVTVALLNTQLRRRALAHCIGIVAPRGVIVGASSVRSRWMPCAGATRTRRRVVGARRRMAHALPRLDLATSPPGAPLRRRRYSRAALDASARSTSTPRAPRDCPRPPMSAICASCSGAHWFAGHDGRAAGRSHVQLPAACITASAAWWPRARCWWPAARS